MAKAVVVIGGGPAGLTSATELVRKGVTTTLLEESNSFGGISRTVQEDGWRFDLGGHRFFTKNERVMTFWRSILNETEFREQRRLSRIYFNGKFFDYPLVPLNALRNLGIVGTFRAISSYIAVKVFPPRDESTFETWVAKRFGWYLYRTFFKTYTEKVWGMPANKIQADWAAQRIKNLSLSSAIFSAFFPKRFNKGQITSLVDTFHYPKLGPGMLWQKCAEEIEEKGGQVLTNKSVTRIERDGLGDLNSKYVVSCQDGSSYKASYVVSSMPLGDLIECLNPRPSDDIVKAANLLRYRDFLTVAVPVLEDESFPDNWIYIHAPHVKVGRIQNYGSWSKDMVKPGFTCLGLEYFVSEGDEIWITPDSELVEMAIRELQQLGLLKINRNYKGFVVRVPKAYPVYDKDFHKAVDTLKLYLEQDWPDLMSIGRNGQHRYNNQDHSMLTGMLAADLIISGEKIDYWNVNIESDYHESNSISADRLTPREIVEIEK